MSDDLPSLFEKLTPDERVDYVRNIALKRLERTGWPKRKPLLTAFLKAATGLQPPCEKPETREHARLQLKKKTSARSRKRAKKKV